MLQSIKLFLTYESLDDDFENYDCESPLLFEHLQRKIEGQSLSEFREEWLSELLKYESYVERISKIRASNAQNKEESFAQMLCEWKETLRLTSFCGFNDVKRFYKMYKEYLRLKILDVKSVQCVVLGDEHLHVSLRMLKNSYIF